MSNPREAPWSESERLYLLAEILKDAGIPSSTFLRIIIDSGVEPRWTEIPLPAGRSLRACQNAFQALLNGPPPLTSPMPIHAGGSPQATTTHMSASPNPRKRPLSSKDLGASGGRALQPRPPAFSSINGQALSPYQTSPGDDPTQPPRKKRGRPSKVELEARAAAAAARGEVYPPPKPPKAQTPNKIEKISTGAQPTGAEEASTGPPQAAATTPEGALSDNGDAGSKGKKRRGRPTKEEAQAKRLLLEAAAAAASGEASMEREVERAREAFAREEPEEATEGKEELEEVREGKVEEESIPKPESSETIQQLSAESKDP